MGIFCIVDLNHLRDSYHSVDYNATHLWINLDQIITTKKRGATPTRHATGRRYGGLLSGMSLRDRTKGTPDALRINPYRQLRYGLVTEMVASNLEQEFFPRNDEL